MSVEGNKLKAFLKANPDVLTYFNSSKSTKTELSSIMGGKKENIFPKIPLRNQISYSTPKIPLENQISYSTPKIPLENQISYSTPKIPLENQISYLSKENKFSPKVLNYLRDGGKKDIYNNPEIIEFLKNGSNTNKDITKILKSAA